MEYDIMFLMKNIFIFALISLSSFGARVADAADGFMSEHWNQASPWNDFMPVFSAEPGASNEGLEGYNRRAPAGCVAIQMAQFLHYWQWPKTYWNLSESTHSVTQTYGKEPYSYSITLHPSGRNPFDYGSGADSMARLAFVCASLANMGFTSNGSGSLPETVFNKLIGSGYYECGESVKKDSTRMKRFLEAGYPLLARGEGHAYILHGWQDDSKTPVFANWGWPNQKGDTWKSLEQIDEIFLCYPKIMPRIDSVPTYVKRPLTITWGFPEAYCSIYKDTFEGFEVNLVQTQSQIKDDPGITMKVGPAVREYTFSNEVLESGKEYRVTVTPIFNKSPLSTVSAHSVEFTVSDTSPDLPKILTAPKEIKVKLRSFSFDVTCSDTVNSLDVSSSVYSINLNNEIYCFDFDNLTSVKNGSTYTITMNAGILPQQFEDQKIILTLQANGTYTEDYADVIVTLVPQDGEESGLTSTTTPIEPDPEPEPQPSEDPKNFVTDGGVADYILISPANFVSSWTAYVKARAIAHPKLTFAVKNAAEIYTENVGTNASEKIKAFIAEQAAKGTKYFVLGGAWSNPATIEKSEISFVTGEGKEYRQTALSLDNTIPGWLQPYWAGEKEGYKYVASDYDYALIDGDNIADIVISRIPLVRWPDEANGSFPSFADIIKGYGEKVIAVESEEFTGNHHYALAAAQLVGSKDGKTDGEIAARLRFDQYFKSNSLAKEPVVVPVNKTAADFFDSKVGWEAVIAKCHGQVNAAHGTGIDDTGFAKTDSLVKFGIFAMPCLTGRPDVTVTFGGMERCLKPSMGIAAICNPKGGEVVGFHNTHDGAGFYDVAMVTKCEDPYATQYEGCLLDALCRKRLNAGDAWLSAHQDYCRNIGTGTWHMYTMHNSVLYGDPLVKLSSPLPVVKVPKVLFR